MRKLRCAVLGAGWWGTYAHVPALKQHPRAELVAIQNHDPRTAEKIARDFDVPRAFTTAEELLAIDDLDAVVVSSTPNLHYPQVKAALERGLHVLVEKPMTHTAAEAEELVDLAARKKLELLIGCTFNYNRHAVAAQEIVRSGALGDIQLICILFMDEVLGLYRGQSWEEFASDNPDPEVAATPYLTPGQKSYSEPEIAGGGQMFTQVSHLAALIPFLTGDRPVEVFGLLKNADTRVDVYDALTVKLARGTIVSLGSGGRIGNAPRHLDVRIYGSKGVIELELHRGTLEHHDFSGETRSFPPLKTELELYPRHDPAANLVDAVLGEAPNRSPGTLGLEAMRIIDGACRASSTGQAVVLG